MDRVWGVIEDTGAEDDVARADLFHCVRVRDVALHELD